jgi:pectate lyase
MNRRGADDGPGSLREACRAEEPLWIVFEVSGTIHLHSYLRVSSYKTIDGRGQRVVLTGKGLQLKSCHHVIICNLVFEGGRGHDVDGIQVKPDSTNIWIDRCTLADYDDGLIDITRQSTDITVSRSFHSSFPCKSYYYIAKNCYPMRKFCSNRYISFTIEPTN